MKKFYDDGISEIKLQNNEVINLGSNPTGIFIYDENGEIIGFQTNDNCLFYSVNEVKAVKFTDDDKFYSIDEFNDEVFFNYENEYIDKKTISERFEAILFTASEWDKLKNEIGAEPTYENFINFISAKAGEYESDLYSAFDFLGYGRYIHCNEDNPYYIDDLNAYPFGILENENNDVECGELRF